MVQRTGGLIAFALVAVGLAASPASTRSASLPDTAKQVTRVETVTGASAAAYVHSLLARDPKVWSAFQASAAEMRSRGFKPTGQTVIVRRYRADAQAALRQSPLNELLRRVFPSVHAQTTSYSDGNGEVIYVSWDDGNDETWEGEQFVQYYSDGYWELTNKQLNIVEDRRCCGQGSWDRVMAASAGSVPRRLLCRSCRACSRARERLQEHRHARRD